MPCSQDEKLLKEMLASITEKFHAAEDLMLGVVPLQMVVYSSVVAASPKSPNLPLALKLTEILLHRTWQKKLKSLRL